MGLALLYWSSLDASKDSASSIYQLRSSNLPRVLASKLESVIEKVKRVFMLATTLNQKKKD